MWTRSRRRLAGYLVVAILVGLGLHVVLPALAGMEHSLEVIRAADLRWVAAAGAFSVLSLGLYVAVFALVVAVDVDGVGWRDSYQIAMASQAASTVVTAGGAGGIALLYWALSRHGMDRAQAASRIVAFLAFHYAVYLGALVLFGAGLWLGVLPGGGPASLTLLPAVIALGLLGVAWLAATRPASVEHRLSARDGSNGRVARLAQRLRRAPATVASGLGYARSLLRPRSRGALLVALAVTYWSSNIAILGSCFLAFGEHPNVAGLVQAFFIGMTANLLPLLPGGVGSVEAGLIAALLAFGEPGAEVVVSVLAYRLIGYWLPTIAEAVAYVQLRRSIGGLEPTGIGGPGSRQAG